ncbi:D-2-hydroxyacid dehydrogenase [Saxibacter everestensis]|uniref:D-2-hydroxyacid dehydrogenase n=1 Tax=Saxibacter everestensis TaxID=2909229 RepID=A0ABY8QU03_9MICO|nr:D-2-hydroxyacid dehydrogenase [Brevibacteriaceae bacterium ZFBP1038]
MSELTLAVLVADQRPDLSGLADVEVRFAEAEQLPAALDGADAFLVWDFSARGIPQAWPRAAELRWMHVNSAGVDRVLTRQIAESNVVMTNARGVLDETIAEYVLGLVLAFAKDLPGTLSRQTEQVWQHRPTERLRGSKALVIGPGAIGRKIAKYLFALGLEVDAVGRTTRDGDPVFRTIHAQARLAEVAGDYDYLIVAAPLTPETRGLVNARVIAALPPNARLINVARGPIVDETALIEALRSGAISGAALDVCNEEPLPAGHPLWNCPNTIISPHMAGDFHGWRAALLDVFLTNLERFRMGQPLLNVVDKKSGYIS